MRKAQKFKVVTAAVQTTSSTFCPPCCSLGVLQRFPSEPFWLRGSHSMPELYRFASARLKFVKSIVGVFCDRLLLNVEGQ